MMVRVVTSNGGIMELYSPITVECITNEFPGHAIFPSSSSTHHHRNNNNIFSSYSQLPLPKNEQLQAGELYYLLPLINPSSSSSSSSYGLSSTLSSNGVTTQLADQTAATTLTPYRMSTCDKNNNSNSMNMWSDSEQHEVFPRYNNGGVWKVKLVISPEKLSEILSQESRTEALIESVRTVAKCGNGVAPSVANSDQWSVSNSWKGSMLENMGV